MPPRSLVGTLFAAAAVLWWFLIGVLSALVAPAGNVLGTSFWIGAGLMIAAGFGWGALLAPPLLHHAPVEGAPLRGLVRFVAGGVALLFLIGGTALLLGLLIAFLTRAEATWSAFRQAFARPPALALPGAALALIGLPLGAAVGVILHAMRPPHGQSGSPSAPNGSRRRPLR